MWGKSLESIKNFAMDDAKAFFRTKLSMSVDSNFKRGYKFFCDSYISNIWTIDDAQTGQTSVKAECYKSQRKNEKPHNLQIILTHDGKIAEAHCSCAIGNSECCGHLVGLCYTLQHFILKDMTEIPEELSCTDLPQKWGKPRGKKVEPNCLLNVIVYAPSEKNRQRGPIRCSLSENPCLGNNLISEETIKRGRSELMDVDENRAMSYLLSAATNDNVSISLPLNLMVQENSVLHMQMISSEFNVYNNICPQDTFDSSPFYQELPIIGGNYTFKFPNPRIFLPELKITHDEALTLEKRTRTQSQSHLWIKARTVRLTASNFGEVFYRKKKPNEKFLKRIFGHRDLSHVASIRHGLTNESAARAEYLRQRPNINVLPSGLVINPKAPFIGASPDSHLVDPLQKNQENGVLEIKCPATWGSLKDGLTNPNGYLLLCENTGQYILDTTHMYYCQVQGQMLVCGVQWCDFVVYIKKTNELNIQRIHFDNQFCEIMFDKLQSFYEKFALPYIKTLTKENIL